MTQEKTWYMLYTKPRWEKKVAEALTRKNIENYCPLNRVRKQTADRNKILFEPLFSSYVFVRITEQEHAQLRKIDGVINFVYWIGKPAIIKDAEIEFIRNILSEYQHVKLEKLSMNSNDFGRVTSGPLMNFERKVPGSASKSVKIVLPSLGYMMFAEVEEMNVAKVGNTYYMKKEMHYQYASRQVI